MQAPKCFAPFFADPKTHNIFEGGRGGGKTRTIGQLIVETMLQAPLNVICGREIQKSLKESSFAILKNEIERGGYLKYFNIRESDSTITSHTGGRAVFTGLQQHTTDSIKSYEGFHWAWIEEAQSISKGSLENSSQHSGLTDGSRQTLGIRLSSFRCVCLSTPLTHTHGTTLSI